LKRPYKVVYIHVSEDDLKKRLALRQEKEKRADDDLDAIALRFERFKEHTVPAIEFFRKEGTLVEVSGEHPIEDVHVAVMQALKLV